MEGGEILYCVGVVMFEHAQKRFASAFNQYLAGLLLVAPAYCTRSLSAEEKTTWINVVKGDRSRLRTVSN